MASYHTSFDYLGKNSAEQGYIIAAFEPDKGFKDAFLDMDQISEDYYDGTKKFLYGTRYNSTASINVTLIKMNGTDWSIDDNRKALRWLTGARTASWLDLYQGNEIKYSFLGTVKSPQQYKLDGRVVGISFEFASITPWAYSAEQVFDRSIDQILTINDDGILIKVPEHEISVSDDGVLCNSSVPGPGACFCVDGNGIMYVTDIIVALIDNETDDLYSYIYLDIEICNDTCKSIEIKNESLGETTRVEDLLPKDIIRITNKQFIMAYTEDQITGELVNQNRIFGDSFNFVWPRLVPGVNNFVIEGDGNSTIKFSYRYPMKIGNCAMDVDVYGGDIICGGCDDDTAYGTIRWQDITGTPTTLEGYGITNAYTTDEVYTKSEVYAKDEVYNKYETYSKTEVDDKIDDIEISGGGGPVTGDSITIDEDKLNKMLEDILT